MTDLQKKVLVAEDDKGLSEIISKRLDTAGYAAHTASDGARALDKIKSEEPDLLILDLMIPKIDGFRVCKMLKSDAAHRDLPIIVLTGMSRESDIKAALASGADAYLIKPFDIGDLLDKVKILIG